MTPADAARAHARRLGAQLLAGRPAGDAPTATRRLLAVQAQDARGARLAIRARTRGVSSADVDRALTEGRSLVISWLNRGTLHLVAAEDFFWLHALTTPPLVAGCARRLAQEGVTDAAAERGVAVIARALADEGPLTREQLASRLATAGVRTEGQALVHLLFRATLEGVCVRGPMAGRHHAFALVHDWLGPAPRFDREPALDELARRYLAGHGPAGERDLARWSGLPLRDARAGLAAIASQLRTVGEGLVELSGAGRTPPLPPPRLLGAFEPVLMGWTSRAWVLGEHEAAVVTGGIFRGFAMAGGRAVGLWRLERERVTVEPLAPLDADALGALERDGRALAAFLSV